MEEELSPREDFFPKTPVVIVKSGKTNNATTCTDVSGKGVARESQSSPSKGLRNTLKTTRPNHDLGCFSQVINLQTMTFDRYRAQMTPSVYPSTLHPRHRSPCSHSKNTLEREDTLPSQVDCDVLRHWGVREMGERGRGSVSPEKILRVGDLQGTKGRMVQLRRALEQHRRRRAHGYNKSSFY